MIAAIWAAIFLSVLGHSNVCYMCKFVKAVVSNIHLVFGEHYSGCFGHEIYSKSSLLAFANKYFVGLQG